MNARSSVGLTVTAFLGISAFGLSAVVMGPLLPLIMEALKTGPEQIGIIFFWGNIGFQIVAVLGGNLADRYGCRPLVLTGLVLMTFGNFFCGRIDSLTGLVFAYGLVWMGCAMIPGQLTSLMVDLHPARRGMFVNMMHSFFGLGAILASAGTGLALLNGSTWRQVYGWAALFVLVVLLVAATQSFPRSARENHPFSIKSLLNPAFFTLLGMMIAYGGIELCMTNWICLFMQKEAGLTVFWSSLSLSFFWVAMVAGRLGSGMLVHRLGEKRLVVILGCGGLVSLLMATLSPWPVLNVAGVTLTGLFCGGIFPCVMSLGAHRFPSQAGTVLGVLVAGTGTGAMIFPPLAGALSVSLTLRGALAVMSALFLPILLGIWKLSRDESKAKPEMSH
ncbi:MAG: MFS transporter [Verrucomicrobiae bacterium]|nr:MFS transporter [Verrucomicrobiae bacterium]